MDKVSKVTRSAIMSKIRSRGNGSTERRLRMALVRAGARGWQMHPWRIDGRPDIWFPRQRIAVFADGCFWHNCPRCQINLPRQNRHYWLGKLERNQTRGSEVNRRLRNLGISVVRIWEHELANTQGRRQATTRVLAALKRRAARGDQARVR